jgi:hypothetical protein
MNNVRNWLLGSLVLIAATTAVFSAFAVDDDAAQPGAHPIDSLHSPF